MHTVKTLFATLLISAAFVVAQQATESDPFLEPSVSDDPFAESSPMVGGTTSPTGGSATKTTSGTNQPTTSAQLTSSPGMTTSSPTLATETSASEEQSSLVTSMTESPTNTASAGSTIEWPESLLVQASALVALFAASFAVLLA
ncbi:hypothetical protein BDA99DRAFT_581527 [Phascolomyces articulosus]|uniref:Uncharacterized protein n=1 Tax=Phascolomyces articulosus TaxID=60185 RepID=A0AAD5JZS0_9FUNG|nr:hypothetical protein BDA99DRAFT_581527 [Phascolomyces articulosus]